MSRSPLESPRTDARTARTESLIEKDRRFVWHPFTQMQTWLAEEPVVIESADGVMLRDTLGREYIDGNSSLWCNVHGHRVPEIDAAIRAQLDRAAHTTLLGLANPLSIELAERLVGLAPKGLAKVFYSDDGSTGVEIALKMAFQYWQQNGRAERRRFLAFENAYHGDTIGSVSAGGIELFHGVYRPLLFDCLRAPSPYCYRCPFGYVETSCGMACLRESRRVLAEHVGEIAAVIVEPLVQGAAGMIVMPDGYLKGIEQACREADVFVIADEVAVGFGRTGRMFACEHEDVRPDILVCAKGLTGGYLPLAATLVTQRIYDGFLGDAASRRTFYHGHTYTGNALGCAAALANLDLFDSRNVLAALQPKIEQLARHLERFRELEHVGDVRQRGFMAGIELVADRATREPFPYERQTGHRVTLVARRRGLVTRPLGDVLVVMPALGMPEETLSRMMEILYDSVVEATE